MEQRELILHGMLKTPLRTADDVVALFEAVIEHYGLEDSEQPMDVTIREAMRAARRYLEGLPPGT